MTDITRRKLLQGASALTVASALPFSMLRNANAEAQESAICIKATGNNEENRKRMERVAKPFKENDIDTLNKMAGGTFMEYGAYIIGSRKPPFHPNDSWWLWRIFRSKQEGSDLCRIGYYDPIFSGYEDLHRAGFIAVQLNKTLEHGKLGLVPYVKLFATDEQQERMHSNEMPDAENSFKSVSLDFFFKTVPRNAIDVLLNQIGPLPDSYQFLIAKR